MPCNNRVYINNRQLISKDVTYKSKPLYIELEGHGMIIVFNIISSHSRTLLRTLSVKDDYVNISSLDEIWKKVPN